MSRGRVLVIDDSLTVRMDLAEAFEEAGFEALPCGTAAEARAAIRSGAPALIVLDVVLPDADGVDLLADLRADPATAATPVMLLSSESAVKDRVRGLAEGANEYVGKPYDLAYVVGRASALLRDAGDDAEDGAAPTVLVVDDSRTYREELAERLEAAGYRAALAGSGEEGLRKAADLSPDAIIVDGVMPGLDGTALVRRLRLDPGLFDTPCLLLTAAEGSAGEVVALDAGADAYVRKGEGLEFVLARLGAMLRAAEPSRGRAHASSLLGPKRVLAIDDSETFLEELAGELREEGYEVVKASSGEEGLALLGVESVDCILLDLLMPGLSGTETCAHIKASPSLRTVPLIMLTALEDPRAMIEGMNAGADDYVSKSVDFDVLKARVRAQLRRKQVDDENRRVRDELLRRESEARAAREVAEARAVLLGELERKNRDLERLNEEMRMFAYSVSHDLRQPLRSVEGFSAVLLEEHADRLDAEGRHYLERVRAAAVRMDRLIEGLLGLSRVTRAVLRRGAVRLDGIARRIIERLRGAEPDREVEVHIADGLCALGDEGLLESMLENLLGNAWKFTAGRRPGRVELGVRGDGAFFVRDDGAGFDPRYADRMFAPFQRLHSDEEFAGDGVGLATTQRIIHRHGGRIWAEGLPGGGATFYFTLGGAEALVPADDSQGRRDAEGP